MTSNHNNQAKCDGGANHESDRRLSLPVLDSPSTKIRPSGMSRWRARSLVAVHLLIVAHVVHWLWTGRTLSPVEPSETMYTFNDGHVNAGFVFFAASILATLIFGRFVCGWGCHFIAYQDLCTWLLKRTGIKPKPFRSRLLVLAPLALALYMFAWPSAYRWWIGQSSPPWTNHLMQTNFWATFPGPVVTVLTVLVAGFAIVYFLGSKGFCTYACPYGGFFGVADQLSVGRILVNDSCEHCGHCTATCSSNVKVHEEIALYGMVVDPGCMKCMDCVSVCPNDALSFGFARPSSFTPAQAKPKPRPFDFSLAEELWMAVVGVASLLAFRGLYDRIPLLLAMGMAAITTFLVMKLVKLVRVSNVRFQNLQLKRGGRITRVGIVFALSVTTLVGLASHSGAIQWQRWRGQSLRLASGVGDEVWLPGSHWWPQADDTKRKQVDAAITHLERADRWGLAETYTVLADLVWLYLARDRVNDAETTLHRLMRLQPDASAPYRGLGGVLRKTGRLAEAETAYRRALELDPTFDAARRALCSLLFAQGRTGDAIAVAREGLDAGTGDAKWSLELVSELISGGLFSTARTILENLLAVHSDSARANWLLGAVLIQNGEVDAGLARMRRAVELDPNLGEAHYDLGVALLGLNETQDAITHLTRAAALNPSSAIVHYNLAVGYFMAGRPAEAAREARESIRLDPHDPDAHGFLAMVLEHMGSAAGEKNATDVAPGIRKRP